MLDYLAGIHPWLVGGRVDWGPVAAWLGATATFFVALIALLASFDVFERFQRPRLQVSFEEREPWCRAGPEGLWVRIGVENRGKRPARGCVGRMTGVSTDGGARCDVDPLQLRWAGVPRSRGFEPIELRSGQREYLNVLLVGQSAHGRIVTFDTADFDPGFPLELTLEQEQTIHLAIFADNATTTARLVSHTHDTHTPTFALA